MCFVEKDQESAKAWEICSIETKRYIMPIAFLPPSFFFFCSKFIYREPIKFEVVLGLLFPRCSQQIDL